MHLQEVEKATKILSQDSSCPSHIEIEHQWSMPEAGAYLKGRPSKLVWENLTYQLSHNFNVNGCKGIKLAPAMGLCYMILLQSVTIMSWQIMSL
jgi:hypothetical protein